jgi:hypothetical protein
LVKADRNNTYYLFKEKGASFFLEIKELIHLNQIYESFYIEEMSKIILKNNMQKPSNPSSKMPKSFNSPIITRMFLVLINLKKLVNKKEMNNSLLQ